MALDFPAGASSGQTFSSNGVTWSFDGDKWKISTGTGIEPVFISSSTPTGVDGQLYWDSDESTAYIYYNDGNTAQWVPLVSTAPVTFDATAIVSGTLPVARGGTGITTFDAGKIVEGNTEAEVVDTGSDGHFKVTTEGAERLRIDSSGRLLVGGTNTYQTAADNLVVQGTGQVGITIASTSTGKSNLYFADDTSNPGAYACYFEYDHNTDNLKIGQGNSERIRLDSSGRLLVGATSAAIGSRMDVHAGSDGDNILGITGADQTSEFLALGVTTSQAILSAGNASSNGTSLVLKTADSSGSENERMRIDSSGNVGIGISSVTQRLHVEGSANNQNSEIRITATQVASGYLGANANGFNIGTDTGGIVFKTGVTGSGSVGGTGTERMRIDSNGKLGIGTASPAEALHVVGEIVATGDITAFYSSDRRLKKNIENIPDAVEKVQQINGVSYSWKDKEIDGYFKREKEIGVIAQDVEEVLPEIVATRDDGYKAVRYDRLVALLIEAVKEQQEQIDELKAKLEG